MKITVRLHATLRKHLPSTPNGVAEIELPDGATVRDVAEQLGIPEAHAGMMVSGDEFLEIGSVLREGQEVNLFPPLAGGAPTETGLQSAAARLREHSMRATSEAGSGHPTSCMSAADIVAALFFRVMRYHPKDPGHPDNDRFVLSKGHAAPVLYAAWAEAGAFPVEHLLTLRRIDSELEGHPTPRFAGTLAATGSLGQGLSVGLGAALAFKREGKPQRVYVLLGDGETAEGAVWEAAAVAAHEKLDNLVAIVDVNGLGQSQRTMYGFDTPSYRARFAAFGWHALEIDGHDISAILAAFDEAAKVKDKPVAIIARTKKGKGVSFIEDKDGWHGKPLKKGEELDKAIAEVRAGAPSGTVAGDGDLGSRVQRPAAAGAAGKVEVGAMPAPSYKPDEQVATREAYGAALAKLGSVAPHVYVLDADTKNSTFSDRFLAVYPERFLENFIAEQNMIGAAVGLARSGKIPFLSSFACFLTRGFDHLRMAAISRANIKVAGSHCGVSIGEDGPSQMGLEDLAMMRAIPGSVVLYPSDAVSTERLVEAAARHEGIVYLRLSRPKGPILYKSDEPFPIGGSKVLRSSPKDVATVVAAGVTVIEALKAHDALASEGIAIRVIDAYSVKPIDAEAIRRAGRETKGRVITVEDHYFDGGLGDAVLNAVSGEAIRVDKLAVREVPRSGKPQELVDAYGIGAGSIVAAVKKT